MESYGKAFDGDFVDGWLFVEAQPAFSWLGGSTPFTALIPFTAASMSFLILGSLFLSHICS